VEIRRAQGSDSEAIVRLMAQLGYELDRGSVEDDISTGSGGEVLVAVVDGETVGVLAMNVHRQVHWGANVASIESLVVDASARSAGVGAALIDAGVQRAQEANCILVELHSNHERLRARRFYEREGFTVTSNYFVRRLIGDGE
jgi:ribosomal protein S18 acetylase RimI-like enzyme